MADLIPRERLQPALLDRLTDDDPSSKSESRDDRVMSMRELKAALLRDLEWLFNAKRTPIADPKIRKMQWTRSVINYGLPDLTGVTTSKLRVEEIEAMVDQAIRTFEPRIVDDSLRVRVTKPEDSTRENVIALEIEGELFPLPMPEMLFIRTNVDLESGQVAVREVPGG